MPRPCSTNRALVAVLALLCAELPARAAGGEAAARNPFATSAEGLFPYPSRFFEVADERSPTGVRTALSNDLIALPSGSPRFDFTTFNASDGHSPAAPLLVHFGVDVAPELLVDQRSTERSLAPLAPIALFDLETGARVPILTEMDGNLRTPAQAGRHALIIRPMRPMRMGARHLALLTRDLRDVAGAPLESPTGFALLRDDVASARPEVEALRPLYAQHFAFLAEHGYPRERLLLAWDFMVASRAQVLGGILSMRDQALALAEEGLSYTIERVERDPNDNVALFVEGTFEVPSFLSADDGLVRGADGGAVLQGESRWFPFTMLVPACARTGGPMPLVLFGHGIFGTGRRYLEGPIGTRIIQPLAQGTGAVMIATDFIGLSGGDRRLILSELRGGLGRIHAITDRLQQSLVNNLVLVRLAHGALQRDERVGLGRDTALLSSDTYYYGVSLGGIQGVSLAALSPDISRAVLAVPGGAWSTLLTRSIVYSPMKAVVDLVYPDPLVQQVVVAMMQAKFDGSDGVNLGVLLAEGARDGRRLLLLEAVGDCQVPNLATRMVARAVGVRQLMPFVEPVFGLVPIAGPTTEAVLAQILMPERLEAYSPPQENVLPTRDNGTHSDAILLEPAIEQLLALLSSGVAQQFCDGACDPD